MKELKIDNEPRLYSVRVINIKRYTIFISVNDSTKFFLISPLLG